MTPDLVSLLMQYEDGDLDERGTVALFADLVKERHGLEPSGSLRTHGSLAD